MQTAAEAERLPVMAFSDGTGHDGCLAPSALILPLEHQSAFFPPVFLCVLSTMTLTPPLPSLHLSLLHLSYFRVSLHVSMHLCFLPSLSFSVHICL